MIDEKDIFITLPIVTLAVVGFVWVVIKANTHKRRDYDQPIKLYQPAELKWTPAKRKKGEPDWNKPRLDQGKANLIRIGWSLAKINNHADTKWIERHALMYGVSRNTIRKIVTNKSYRDVDYTVEGR